MEKPVNFLPEKYKDLPGSRPVERAVEKARREGESIPDKKQERIQAYLNRLDRIVKDERGWEILKGKIVKEFAIDIKDEDTMAKIAHGLYESEKKLAIEQGRGADIANLGPEDEILDKYKGLILEKHDIQGKTLESWLSYLRENDAQYPTWFRYFVVRNLEKMGTVDKERGEYSKRTEYTVAPFPELNSEALGFVYRALSEGVPETEIEDKEKYQKLQTLIQNKDFAKLYAFAQIETAGRLNKETIQGEWVKYEQNSDYHILEQALRGKGTGWCTAEGSAYAHLRGGDFYVYFTKGKNGGYTEPRVAIRMEGEQVAEVRGVNPRQELEPALLDLAQDKYHSLPGGEKFDKKSHDMKEITRLIKKQEKGDPFTKEELIFLYEIKEPIEGFGYQKDPRVAELVSQRNPKEDAPIILECEPQEIAWSEKDVNEDTKSYIGPLFKGVFDKQLEHIYSSFPAKEIKRFKLEVGGKNKEELIKELKKGKIIIGGYAEDILNKMEISPKRTVEDLVELSDSDMGLPNGAITQKKYRRAEEIGLKKVKAETGPEYRLANLDQPLGEKIIIGMEPISDSDGGPRIFSIVRDADGLWLADAATDIGNWRDIERWVFSRT